MTANTTGNVGAAGLLTLGASQIGVPYSWGGESPGVDFDCSGLTQWLYAQIGVTIPRTSQAQSAAATPVAAKNAQPGMLVFMAGSDGTASAPGHVGIYLGGGKFLDAPFTGAKVRIDNVPSNATYGAVPGVDYSNAASVSPGILGTIENAGGDLLSAVPGAGLVTGAAGDLSSITTLTGDLTSATWWHRIGIGVLGVALVGTGLLVFFAGSKTGQKTATDVAEVAPLLAA
jgi:hypothetical protein